MVFHFSEHHSSYQSLFAGKIVKWGILLDCELLSKLEQNGEVSIRRNDSLPFTACNTLRQNQRRCRWQELSLFLVLLENSKAKYATVQTSVSFEHGFLSEIRKDSLVKTRHLLD